MAGTCLNYLASPVYGEPLEDVKISLPSSTVTFQHKEEKKMDASEKQWFSSTDLPSALTHNGRFTVASIHLYTKSYNYNVSPELC